MSSSTPTTSTCPPNDHHLGWDPAQTPARPPSPTDDTLLEALARTPEPFFLWLHYKWTHLPYWASEPFRQALGIDEATIPERLWRSVCTGFVVPRAEHRAPPRGRPPGAPPLRRRGAGVQRLPGPRARSPGRPSRARAHQSRADLRPRRGAAGAWPRRARLHRTLLSLAGAPRPDASGLDLSLSALGQPDALEAHPLRDFAFHAARAGCPTPRAMEGHLLRGVSDGRHKLIVSDDEQRQATLYDLEADPHELHPMDPGPDLDGWLQRLARAEAGD